MYGKGEQEILEEQMRLAEKELEELRTAVATGAANAASGGSGPHQLAVPTSPPPPPPHTSIGPSMPSPPPPSSTAHTAAPEACGEAPPASPLELQEPLGGAGDVLQEPGCPAPEPAAPVAHGPWTLPSNSVAIPPPGPHLPSHLGAHNASSAPQPRADPQPPLIGANEGTKANSSASVPILPAPLTSPPTAPPASASNTTQGPPSEPATTAPEDRAPGGRTNANANATATGSVSAGPSASPPPAPAHVAPPPAPSSGALVSAPAVLEPSGVPAGPGVAAGPAPEHPLGQEPTPSPPTEPSPAPSTCPQPEQQPTGTSSEALPSEPEPPLAPVIAPVKEESRRDGEENVHIRLIRRVKDVELKQVMLEHTSGELSKAVDAARVAAAASVQGLRAASAVELQELRATLAQLQAQLETTQREVGRLRLNVAVSTVQQSGTWGLLAVVAGVLFLVSQAKLRSVIPSLSPTIRALVITLTLANGLAGFLSLLLAGSVALGPSGAELISQHASRTLPSFLQQMGHAVPASLWDAVRFPGTEQLEFTMRRGARFLSGIKGGTDRASLTCAASSSGGEAIDAAGASVAGVVASAGQDREAPSRSGEGAAEGVGSAIASPASEAGPAPRPPRLSDDACAGAGAAGAAAVSVPGSEASE